MKASDGVVLALTAGLLAFVALQLRPSKPLTTPIIAVDTAVVALDAGASQGDVVATTLPAPERDIAAIRATLARESNGTFIDDILALRDSNVARWIARPADPVRVWIDERSTLAGYDASFPSQVRRAFGNWGTAGVPLTFSFVADSIGAEVKVTWRDKFDEQISGRTRWVRDVHWWILRGDIELAVRTPGERAVTSPQMHAIALHEIGHLLGLDHTRDSLAIMAPRVKVFDLTPADVATMRLIYTIPPGSVREF